jgi:hypothetical protein
MRALNRIHVKLDTELAFFGTSILSSLILYYIPRKNQRKISHRYWIFENRSPSRNLLAWGYSSTFDEKSGTGEKRFPMALPRISILLARNGLACQARTLF